MDTKKRCGIVTIYDKNYNYGGQLQAYAMCLLLKQHGCDPKVVSFEQSGKKYAFQRMMQLGIKETIIRVANKFIFKIIKSSSNYSNGYNIKIDRFNEFMNDIPHTKTYSEQKIKDADQLFDFYVCGSDQIWNPGWWNEFYFLKFTNKPKFSYAASIGRENLTPREKKYIQESTVDYIGIAVRERQAEKMLASFTGKKIVTVLDPTLMVPKSTWEQISVAPDYGEYALIYKLGEVTETAQQVYEYCHKNGIKVVSIGHAHNTYDRGDINIADEIVDNVGPREWLGLIKNAKCVFTDSFHGTVFSIIFNKAFWCFEKTNKASKSENTRLYNLLNMLQINDRVLNEKNFESKIENAMEIDYGKITEVLNVQKKESNAYINDCLKKIM